MNILVLLLTVVSIYICNSNYAKGQDLDVCWPHRVNTLCSNIEHQCNSSLECHNNDNICCRYECGTICLPNDQVVREPQPLEKCWKFNSSVVNCFRFDMMCESNIDCGSNQICCEHECGKICRDTALLEYRNQRIKRDDPKTCPPPVTGITCTMTTLRCHTNDDCIPGNICCGIPCGTKCI